VSLPSQAAALTANGLRHVPQRLGGSLVVVVGIAGVVAVLIPVLAMYLGFRATLRGDGRDDRAIVLSRAAEDESESSLSRDAVAVVANAPGVRRDASGEPLVSAEVILPAPVARKRDHSDVSVTMRGVGAQYFALRPELRLIAGRMFRPGNQELVVGAAARAQFEGLDIGNQVRLQDGDWTVVGVFAGGNGSRESELITDATTAMAAYKLDGFNSMTVALSSPGALAPLRERLAADARLFVVVRSEPEYLEGAASGVNRLLRLVTYAIGSIMALGALFAALNSMYAAVASRATEVATLRAIGFAAPAVAIALLAEALLLALAGAALGVALAYAGFNGVTISTLGGALFDSQLVYSLSVSVPLVAGTIGLACALGLAGGLLPAIRASRASIAEGLHEK